MPSKPWLIRDKISVMPRALIMLVNNLRNAVKRLRSEHKSLETRSLDWASNAKKGKRLIKP